MCFSRCTDVLLYACTVIVFPTQLLYIAIDFLHSLHSLLSICISCVFTKQPPM